MRDTTVFFSKRLGRIGWFKLIAGFAVSRGRWPTDVARLFYHAVLKPSFSYRGWARFDRRRIMRFSVRTLNGHKVAFYARDNKVDVGTFEEFFSSRHTILPSDLPAFEPKIIYDIGANIGVTSLYFGAAFRGARIMGFEPYPDNVEVCRLNYQNLPGSEVFPWAIGERTTVGSFELTGSDPRGGSLNQTPNSGPDGTTKQRIDVEVFSIQDLIETKKLPLPDFVKIDVEGAEMEVLRGIGTAGASIRRMYIETHGEKLMVECMKWVLDHGFTIPHVHSAGPGYAGIWCDRVQAGPA